MPVGLIELRAKLCIRLSSSSYPNVIEQLEEIKVPVLLISSLDDLSIPVSHTRKLETLPGFWKTEIFDSGGHAPTLSMRKPSIRLFRIFSPVFPDPLNPRCMIDEKQYSVPEQGWIDSFRTDAMPGRFHLRCPA